MKKNPAAFLFYSKEKEDKPMNEITEVSISI